MNIGTLRTNISTHCRYYRTAPLCYAPPFCDLHMYFQEKEGGGRNNFFKRTLDNKPHLP